MQYEDTTSYWDCGKVHIGGFVMMSCCERSVSISQATKGDGQKHFILIAYDIVCHLSQISYDALGLNLYCATIKFLCRATQTTKPSRFVLKLVIVFVV